MTAGGRLGQAVTGLVLAAAGTVLLVELAESPRVPVSDPLGPHGLPRVVAAGLLLVGVALLVGAGWRHWRAHRAGAAGPPPAGPQPSAAEPSPGERPAPAEEPAVAEPADGEPAPGAGEAAPTASGGGPRLPPGLVAALTMAATAGYVFALTRLGFVVATGLLGFLLLPLLGARRWPTVIGVPVGLTAVLWFVFGYVLGVGLPELGGR